MEDTQTPKDPLVPQEEATSPFLKTPERSPAVNNPDISFLLSEIRHPTPGCTDHFIMRGPLCAGRCSEGNPASFCSIATAKVSTILHIAFEVIFPGEASSLQYPPRIFGLLAFSWPPPPLLTDTTFPLMNARRLIPILLEERWQEEAPLSPKRQTIPPAPRGRGTEGEDLPGPPSPYRFVIVWELTGSQPPPRNRKRVN